MITNIERIQNELFEEFDFEKVHKAMVSADWKWSMGKGRWDVPAVEEIREKATKLFKELMDSPHLESISSGGIRIFFDSELGVESRDCIKIEFILERASSFLSSSD
jgi:hypothetical protein